MLPLLRCSSQFLFTLMGKTGVDDVGLESPSWLLICRFSSSTRPPSDLTLRVSFRLKWPPVKGAQHLLIGDVVLSSPKSVSLDYLRLAQSSEELRRRRDNTKIARETERSDDGSRATVFNHLTVKWTAPRSRSAHSLCHARRRGTWPQSARGPASAVCSDGRRRCRLQISSLKNRVGDIVVALESDSRRMTKADELAFPDVMSSFFCRMARLLCLRLSLPLCHCSLVVAQLRSFYKMSLSSRIFESVMMCFIDFVRLFLVVQPLKYTSSYRKIWVKLLPIFVLDNWKFRNKKCIFF